MASTSRTSPAKNKAGEVLHSSVELFIADNETPPQVTNSSLNRFLPIIL